MENQESINKKHPTDDPPERRLNRKTALKKIRTSGTKALGAVLPLSLIGLTAKKTSAQFRDLEAARAFNYVLQIEFMQEAFYLQATTRAGLIDSEFEDIFFKIRQQHQSRVVFIKNIVGSLGVEPTPQLTFNFGANGRLNLFSSFDNFLGLAQIVEDLSAGVYKEQANNIYQNEASADIKRLVLRLHSTETRHAYYIRFLRAQRGLDDIKGWIDQSDLGMLSDVFANIYEAEANTTQEEIDVSSVTGVTPQAVREAWDEPIGRGLANSILQLFTRPL